jgi:transposase
MGSDVTTKPKKSASPPPYPHEYRRRLIELVSAGLTPGKLARQFEPTARSIRNQVRQPLCLRKGA